MYNVFIVFIIWAMLSEFVFELKIVTKEHFCKEENSSTKPKVHKLFLYTYIYIYIYIKEKLYTTLYICMYILLNFSLMMFSWFKTFELYKQVFLFYHEM